MNDTPGTGHTQWYIGAPNGVMLCINECSSGIIRGVLFHSYSTEGFPFSNVREMTSLMERLYNDLKFPHPGTNERTFAPEQKNGPQPQMRPLKQPERKKIMSDSTLLSKHGDLGTFIVRVQHRQNSSWQGRITWMEEDKTIHFRSIWEMIKLIESAVDTVSPAQDDDEQEPDWFKGGDRPGEQTKA